MIVCIKSVIGNHFPADGQEGGNTGKQKKAGSPKTDTWKTFGFLVDPVSIVRTEAAQEQIDHIQQLVIVISVGRERDQLHDKPDQKSRTYDSKGLSGTVDQCRDQQKKDHTEVFDIKPEIRIPLI